MAVVTSSKHLMSFKGMFLESKALTTTTLDLIKNPNIFVEMKNEFDKSRKGYVYTCEDAKDKKPQKRFN